VMRNKGSPSGERNVKKNWGALEVELEERVVNGEVRDMPGRSQEGKKIQFLTKAERRRKPGITKIGSGLRVGRQQQLYEKTRREKKAPPAVEEGQSKATTGGLSTPTLPPWVWTCAIAAARGRWSGEIKEIFIEGGGPEVEPAG